MNLYRTKTTHELWKIAATGSIWRTIAWREVISILIDRLPPEEFNRQRKQYGVII